MRSPLRIAHSVRIASILAVGAFAVHQLRYLLAPGVSAAEHSGHGYMTDLLAPLAVLILAGVLATLIRGTEGASPEPRSPVSRRIALFAAALLAIYSGQELLEAVLTGQAVPPAALLGGGWIAIPLSVGIGTLAALLAKALERVERAIAVAHERRVRSRPPTVSGRALPAQAVSLISAPLAFGLARRPPPALA